MQRNLPTSNASIREPNTLPTNSGRAEVDVKLSVLAALLPAMPVLQAEPGRLLWQIGNPDNNNREFALAPKGYSDFRENGFFVVGRSDTKRDWPYVHPGPHDAWAGGRQHTFTILFGVKTILALVSKTARA